MSWGAVFAGGVLALGIWLLLYVLGLGIGLVVIDPSKPGSLRGAGMTTGIWSIIVPLVAMFVGGLAAAKVGGAMTRTAAVIHGAVLWSLATLASVAVLASVLGGLVGGAARLGGAAASAAGDVAAKVAPDAMSSAAIDTDDLLGPVNQRLQAAGKPPITADQLGNAAQSAMKTAVREGRLDRSVLERSLASTTALSRQDVRDVAQTIEQRYDQQVTDLGNRAEHTALQAAETTGKGLLGAFFAMLLGLLAAIGGSLVGISRGQRAVAERVTERAERFAAGHA
jgi:hypothetical protein